MVIGTTPTFRFNLPIDASLVDDISVAFFQKKGYCEHSVSIQKNGSDVTFEGNSAIVVLTERETYMFQPGLIEVQLKVRIGDKVLASDIHKVKASRNIVSENLVEAEEAANREFMESLEIEKLADYFYSIKYDDIDYNFERKNYEGTGRAPSMACSSMRKGNFYGRNLDWTYDEIASFFIRVSATETRHASIGMARGTAGLDQEFVESGKYSKLYKLLPFLTMDGINDAGVVCNINVVPPGDNGYTTGTNPDGENLCILSAPRFILDNAGSAAEAVDLLLSANIFSPLQKILYEYHLMIADASETYVVEFINNEVVVRKTFVDEKPIMTNFYLTDWDGTNETLTSHASGTERYDILAEAYNGIDDEDDMMEAMKSVWFTNAYDWGKEPFWYSDYNGDFREYGFGDLTINSSPEEYEPLFNYYHELLSNKKRNGKLWQTVHTAVYNIEEKKFIVSVQENEDKFSFSLDE